MGIHLRDYNSNEEVFERAIVESIESLLMLRQLRWTGHFSRMDDSRIPKAVFYGELKQGNRDRGAPKERFKYLLKDSSLLQKLIAQGGKSLLKTETN